jgi:NADPH2:quinone reductase
VPASRAWVVRKHGEPVDALCLEDVAHDPLAPAQLRIRVHAAALALPDVFMCRGMYPLTPPLPFTPGQEVAGTVVEAGPQATTPLGARVMAITDFVHRHGGFAEHVIADEDNAYAVPAGMGDAEAAGFLIAYQTAWIGLVRRAQLATTDTVLVLGAAGGTGSAAVQLARALGATVVAVANGEAKSRHCRALGAHHVVDRSRDDVADAVRALTGGRGASVVYDPVGGAAADAALRCIANEGRFLAVGFAAGAWPRFDAHRLVVGNYSAVGVYAGAYTRPERVEMVAALAELVARGALRPCVTPVAFEDLPAALAGVAAGTTCGRPVATFTLQS